MPRKKKPQQQPVNCAVAPWITTEELDDELWKAIVADSSGGGENSGDFAEIDEYFAADEEEEDSAEHRKSTLRVLAILRPYLSDLLGGPPTE